MKNRYKFKRIMKEIREIQKDFEICGIFTNVELAHESAEGGIRKINADFKYGIEIWYDRNRTNPSYYLVVTNPLFKNFVKKNMNMNINGMDRCNSSWIKFGKKCEFIG